MRPMNHLTQLVISTLLCVTSVASSHSIEGIWTGEIQASSGATQVIMHITSTGPTTWTGSVDTPSQDSYGIPLSHVSFSDSTLTVMCDVTNAIWVAKLDSKTDELRGEWTQRGMSLPLTCTHTPSPPPMPTTLAGQLIGTWEGMLNVGVVQLRLVLHLERNSPTTIAGYMISPDQSPEEIPIGRIDWTTSRALNILLGGIGSTFDVSLSDANNVLTGTFSQGGATFDISLKRVEVASIIKRPQTPQPPFPYDSIEVTYQNAANDITFAGTLTTPRSSGPFPAVLMITGSGGQDRNEEIFQHKPFWVIADALTRRGIAVLRIDDRGVGGTSTQLGQATNPGTATTFDFANDVEAGVAFLSARDEIGKIGLIGHSEGGVIAPLVAARDNRVAFIVLLAGTGVRGDRLLVSQNRLLMQAMGADDEAIESSRRMHRALWDVVLDESLTADESVVHIRSIIESDPEFAAAPEDERAAGMKQALSQLTSPWIRAFARYDPAPTLSKVSCPVLAINGEVDLQVPYKANLDAIAAALKKGNNNDYTIRAFPGLNHLFQHSESGLVSEYGQIEETISQEVLDFIADWISVRFLPQHGQ